MVCGVAGATVGAVFSGLGALVGTGVKRPVMGSPQLTAALVLVLGTAAGLVLVCGCFVAAVVMRDQEERVARAMGTLATAAFVFAALAHLFAPAPPPALLLFPDLVVCTALLCGMHLYAQAGRRSVILSH